MGQSRHRQNCRLSMLLFLYLGSGFTSPCPKETGNLPSVKESPTCPLRSDGCLLLCPSAPGDDAALTPGLSLWPTSLGSAHSTPRSEARGMPLDKLKAPSIAEGLRIDTERRFLPRFKNRGLPSTRAQAEGAPSKVSAHCLSIFCVTHVSYSETHGTSRLAAARVPRPGQRRVPESLGWRKTPNRKGG